MSTSQSVLLLYPSLPLSYWTFTHSVLILTIFRMCNFSAVPTASSQHFSEHQMTLGGQPCGIFRLQAVLAHFFLGCLSDQVRYGRFISPPCPAHRCHLPGPHSSISWLPRTE